MRKLSFDRYIATIIFLCALGSFFSTERFSLIVMVMILAVMLILKPRDIE